MKFTLSWLNQFISTASLSSIALAEKLTMLGLEVDSLQDLFVELEPFITARVVQVKKHPDADKLTVCEVDTGSQTIQVVCGAPNVRPGLVTALALPGVKLPDGTKIKKSKVRGVHSEGMLCSSRELGLNDEHQGILELADQIPAGQSLRQTLGLVDTVIEVDLTPNRPDCASVRGIAREVGGVLATPIKPLVAKITPLADTHPDYQVIVKEADLCPRYTARRLSHVAIGPSPQWMQQRLIAVGMRPINNIVDITNYVMLESGQPLHAFDFHALKGRQIVVRRPEPHEITLTTLDGKERQLDRDMLLICDGERPVAMAGVMGGLDTEITEDTTTILIESACFDPVSIRRTARKLGLPSESSYRFERGVDPNLANVALERAVELMVEYGGAIADASGIDIYPGEKKPLELTLRVERVNGLLGLAISQDDIARHLQNIEFIVQKNKDNTLKVTVPSFRIDIEREIDLIEEVARVVGYNEIPTTQPMIRMDYPKRDALRSLRQEINHIFTAQGFYEAINYSFISEQSLDICRLDASDPRRKVTRLLNPLSEEQGIMRPLLLPGLLDNVRRNINFQRADLRLFETGKVFLQNKADALPEERLQLCAVISGYRYPEAKPLYFPNQACDLFDIKGAVVNLLETLRIDIGNAAISFLPTDKDAEQPYAEAKSQLCLWYGKEQIGTLGSIHPETLKGFGIKQPVFFAEIDIHKLQTLPRLAKQFRTLPRYPSVKRDISLVVPDSVSAGDLLGAIAANQNKYIETTDIFDVYRGKPIPNGYKSVALAITYRSATTTLDDQTVDKFHDKIVNALMAAFNARYREGSEE